MADCKNCKTKILEGNLLECPNCGVTMCTDCANKTQKVCPYCYHNLEYIG